MYGKQDHTIKVVDSHTGGEPTRVIVSGGPNLGTGSIAERLAVFQEKFDHLRSALIREPRGSDVMVGALLCPPQNPDNAAGVIFFNNVGYLGMCGHGTIGVVATLARSSAISPGTHRLETPVGEITFLLHNNHRVSVENVPSYRYRKGVPVYVDGFGRFIGDIAWGGNWFFLISEHGQFISQENTDHLTDFCWRVRQALREQGICAENGEEIDHIELFAPPSDPTTADSRNFVLCPGKVYDRSPCGTGTSAKLACLYGDGIIKAGQAWRQESIIGSIFEGKAQPSLDTEAESTRIIPTITGNAYISAETTIIFDPEDPFAHGF
ncbi:proline racemase family protein [Microbulbifer spongiae]|uniref:Proline racemase family protein n=1 Tax=Microbulbifer spongiae TaxID=2944933 RepID=A0ABY9EBI9_9GAMM|nr:proline racemase family protein [Microbulbifer sp. MI-G]WKD48141.1 proline racemase family protein [Microbulbifer sp. MI-G]